MHHQKFRRAAILALVLSLGAVSIPLAEAVPFRDSGSIIREELSSRTLLQSMVDFLRGLAAPQPPGHEPAAGAAKDHHGNGGSGACPHGGWGNYGNHHHHHGGWGDEGSGACPHGG